MRALSGIAVAALGLVTSTCLWVAEFQQVPEGFRCPDHDEMIRIPDSEVCIDRYEASPTPSREAFSTYDADPWADVDWAQALVACEAAGKRLCTKDEWVAACQGSDVSLYPYGDSPESGRCNGAEREDGSGVVPTGSFLECEGGFPGLFDMSGNVAEWTSGCAGFECDVLGGSFIESSESNSCLTESATSSFYSDSAIGFRCCLDL